jgi:hypothetical protein
MAENRIKPLIVSGLPVPEPYRCVTRWERQKPGRGHPHRCIRETDHDGPHWCSCGASLGGGDPDP